MGQTLSQDVAIVTGAGRGIGRAIAVSLAAEGAAVGVLARTEAETAATAALMSDAGGRAVPTAPAWLQRAGLEADVIGTGAKQRGSGGGGRSWAFMLTTLPW